MKRSLNAVMAYEEAGTSERAREGWDHLACTLSNRYGRGLRLWNFDALQIPEIRKGAAAEAARADMIVIVTCGAGELPDEVKAWIEAWLAEKCEMRHDQGGLTVLFDAPAADDLGASALCQFAYLQRVARKANMEFFVSTFDQLGDPTGLSRLQFNERLAPRDVALSRRPQRKLDLVGHG